MHRTTILLDDDIRRRAARRARAEGLTLSEWIRRRLAEGVGGQDAPERNRFFSRLPWTGPGPTDTASNHDDYLYGR